MNHQDFINGNFDPDRWLYDFNYPYHDFDSSHIVHQVGRFGGSESAAPIQTTELNENQGRLSADEEDYEADLFANNDENFSSFNDEEEATDTQSINQSEQTRGDSQGSPYTYDRFGQLEGSEGFEKEVIEYYICNHHLYDERRNYKDCGLTLWIQRAPQITDYLDGAAPALCLYRDCCVNQSRYIEPESIRIAFDEKTSRGHDPQMNAGYVHLKCLEKYIPYFRQMFGIFNFKVEGRGPQKNGPWLRNPTIFSTINAIAYTEEYLEDCRKESMVGDGDRITDQILLSAGIEKQSRSQYPATVRDVERKILELEGWDDMKALIDLKYAQACGTAPIASSIESPQQVSISKSKGANKPSPSAYSMKKDHDNREKMPAVNQGQQQDRRRYGSESSTTEQYTLKSLSSSKGCHKKRDPHPNRKEPEMVTEPHPLRMGEGKVKWRTCIRNGEEVWEQYEDLWSPLISDLEENTEDDGLLEDDGPKTKRKRRLRGRRSKAKKRKQQRNDKDSEDDEPSAKRRRRSGDGEDSEEYEPRARRRLRSEDEEPRGHRRRRVYMRTAGRSVLTV